MDVGTTAKHVSGPTLAIEAVRCVQPRIDLFEEFGKANETLFASWRRAREACLQKQSSQHPIRLSPISTIVSSSPASIEDKAVAVSYHYRQQSKCPTVGCDKGLNVCTPSSHAHTGSIFHSSYGKTQNTVSSTTSLQHIHDKPAAKRQLREEVYMPPSKRWFCSPPPPEGPRDKDSGTIKRPNSEVLQGHSNLHTPTAVHHGDKNSTGPVVENANVRPLATSHGTRATLGKCIVPDLN